MHYGPAATRAAEQACGLEGNTTYSSWNSTAVLPRRVVSNEAWPSSNNPSRSKQDSLQSFVKGQILLIGDQRSNAPKSPLSVGSYFLESENVPGAASWSAWLSLP